VFLDPECAETAGYCRPNLIPEHLHTRHQPTASFVVQLGRRRASNRFAKASAKKREPRIVTSSLAKKDLKSRGPSPTELFLELVVPSLPELVVYTLRPAPEMALL
jgi:hypothetical protein